LPEKKGRILPLFGAMRIVLRKTAIALRRHFLSQAPSAFFARIEGADQYDNTDRKANPSRTELISDPWIGLRRP
jgi:hypothetical protein